MVRTAQALCAAALLGSFPLASAKDEGPRLKEALALEEAMQEVIKSAEPSVACVLVSRSTDYEKFERAAPAADGSGRLGEFYADKVAPSSRVGEDPRRDLAKRLDLSDPDNVPEAFGSGVVLDERERLVLTNYHVIRDATKVYVRLPGDKGSYANIHAADPRSDLAVLQLIDRTLRVKAIKLGDGRAVRKGQFVVSLANPYAAGFRDGSPSASYGIISNVRRRAAPPTHEHERSKLPLAHYGTLLQLDARLNLGCSGGAVLNLKGEMVGLTSSLAAVSGVETPGGFAVPLEPNILAILEVLKRGEEVEYGFLGVTLPLAGRRAEAYQIGKPIGNSPAEKAKLREDDYIVAINGVKVRDADDLFLQIGTGLAGQAIKLEVARDPRGPTEVKTAVLVKAYVPGKVIASQRPDPRQYGGLRVDYSSIVIQKVRSAFGQRIPNGVMIREVVPGSAADKARLQEDKLITHVNGRPVYTPAEFYREMRNAAGTVELTVAALDERPDKVKLELP